MYESRTQHIVDCRQLLRDGGGWQCEMSLERLPRFSERLGELGYGGRGVVGQALSGTHSRRTFSAQRTIDVVLQGQCQRCLGILETRRQITLDLILQLPAFPVPMSERPRYSPLNLPALISTRSLRMSCYWKLRSYWFTIVSASASATGNSRSRRRSLPLFADLLPI